MEREGASERQKYVWDRDKLAWVEAAEKPVAETEPIGIPAEKGPIEPAEEEYLEGAPTEVSPVYAEAEALQYRGAWIRLAGVGIDFLLLGIFSAISSLVLNALDISLSSYLLSIIGVFYFVGFWTWRGQTPGKMAISAKIVRIDGSSVGLGRAFLRYIGYFIYLAAIQLSLAYVGWYMTVIVFIIIFLLTALNRNKRGPHDLIAGTVVINTRPKPLEDYEEEEGYEEEYEGAYEAEEEVEASEES